MRPLLALALLLAACRAPAPQPTPAVQPPLVDPASAVGGTPPTAPAPTAAPVSTLTAAPAPTGQPGPPTDTPTPAPLTYIVKAGDTLSGIALEHGVTVESLQAANGLEGDFIFAGQALVIPRGTVVPPTPAVSPTRPARLEVVSFTVDPNPVERGAPFTVRWDVAEALKVTVWAQVFDRKTGRWYRVEEPNPDAPLSAPLVSSEAEGEWTGHVSPEARHGFRFDLEARDVLGALVTAQSEVVELQCHPLITRGGYCPFAPQSSAAVYQQFEKGHLIWRADTGQIVVIPANPAYYLAWFITRPTPYTGPGLAPPLGRHPPGERFAGLWAWHLVTAAALGAGTPAPATQPLGGVLGWAVAPPQDYELTAQIDLDNTRSGLFNDRLYVTLPDGRIAALTLYDGARGTTGPAWAFVTPQR